MPFPLAFLNGRSDYTLLPSGPTWPASKGYSRRYLFILAIIVLSVGLNIFLIVVPRNSKDPLDNYQALNTYPIIDQAALPQFPNASAPHHDEWAVVTTLYTNSYASAVATLGHSLRRANTTARLIVLYFPDQISTSSLCLAKSSGFVPHPVYRIPPPHGGKGVYSHFLDQFTKLHVWTLDQLGVKSLVYLDADTLVRRNFDELFTMPFTFAAVPDVFPNKPFTLDFNAGVLLVRPSTSIFNSLVAQIGSADFPPVDAEQSYLNHYFGAEVVRLPYAYNANLAIKRKSAKLWEGMQAEQRVVHFTLIKPFLGSGYAPVEFNDLEEHVQKVAETTGKTFREEMLWWGEMFTDFKKTYGGALTECNISVSR